MKKIYITLLAAFLMLTPNLISAQSDIVITEIMYNTPSIDSAEFIEIYNNGPSSVDLTNYSFSHGVTFTFPNVSLNAGEYYVITLDAADFNTIYGFAPDAEWTSGNLTNTSEIITIVDGSGNMIDSVVYDDGGPNWPTGTDGQGASINLCNPNADNNDGANWSANTNDAGTTIGSTAIFASPGSGAGCPTACVNTNSTFSVTECTTYTVPSGDETYNTPSTVTVADTISNHCGLDSIMTITVTILPVLTGNDNSTICATGSIVINGTTYDATTSTGTEVFTSIGPNNCDSTVTVALNVLSAIDVSVTNTSPTLTANQTGATYRWLDCNNANAVISGETGISYAATSNGNYAVEITIGNCVDTSACENITISNINEVENSNISIYPNPTENIFTIDFSNVREDVNYTLTSVEGRIIKQQQNVTEQTISIDLSEESKGIYLLKVDNNSSVNVYRIVRQ